jgi:hypothetical protein
MDSVAAECEAFCEAVVFLNYFRDMRGPAPACKGDLITAL